MVGEESIGGVMARRQIFATKQRRMILEEHGIEYMIDVFLNFVFRNDEVEEQACKILRQSKQW